MSTSLTIVPTPIGNLEDITFRAIDVLKDADLVLAEDTRQTVKLFKHYSISTKLQSFHQHNEHKAVPKYVDLLKRGMKIALVSDAGTPGISDPGFLLIRACVEEGISVSTLPGATAFVPALVSSGIPCDRFVFEGFLPQKKGRQQRLKNLSEEQRTMVFYESPHRIVKLLKEFCEFFGQDRSVSISREITKIHEEVIHGTAQQLQQNFEQRDSIKGEFVVVVAGLKK